MAIPAIAAAASQGGTAAGAASSGAAQAALSSGIQAGSGIIGSLVQSPFAKRRQKRNFEYAKKLAEYENDLSLKNAKEIGDYNQQIYEKNRQHDEARQDYLNANSKKIEADALRAAGFNPAWSQEGAGSLTYQSTSQGGTASTPSASATPFDYGSDPTGDALKGLFGGTADFFDKMYQYKMMQADIDLKKSQSKNLDTNTEGKEMENDFFRNTKDLKEQMTNGEYEQMLKLQDIYKQNPELLHAIASAQATLNEKISMESAKMETEMDEIVANVGRANSETRLNHERVLTEQLHRVLSQSQFELMKDANFRANVSNAGYLVHKSWQIEHSNLPDNEKDEQLALCRKFLDECSGYSEQQRQHSHESAMQNRGLRQSAEFHEDEMEIKGAEILVRSFDTLEGTVRHWTNRKDKQQKQKKNNYGKKRGRESRPFRKYLDIFENQ